MKKQRFAVKANGKVISFCSKEFVARVHARLALMTGKEVEIADRNSLRLIKYKKSFLGKLEVEKEIRWTAK